MAHDMRVIGGLKARRTELKQPLQSESSEARASRVRRVVEKGKADGEKVPPGVKLIDTREPTEAERAFGATLEQQARGCLARGAHAAA